MESNLPQIIDPSLPVQELNALASSTFCRAWDESLDGKQTEESYNALCEEANAYLYIAWLKQRGFTVSK